MHNEFEMSMMGELKFFLGIQIHQSIRGIFINQAKYAREILQKHGAKYAHEILKKHGMTLCDSIDTPMATKPLDTDLIRTPIDQTKYHSVVKALMYLTGSRPNIMHVTCYYARYQARPTEKRLKELANLFNKALPDDRFKYLVRRLGMRCLTPDEPEVLANKST
uniref:Reverse transcriptase Ty1/copia-type domain-containing protein n=1 Tax=Tanacetum cinerariifolium TaxID=118510 RepID=A0A6L2KPQ8_TANCI|nr:hypothetical protein [Tanacetum cinerariifolium]